jgi:gamma-glutamylcyclotransferase (GGCT)/AIG2-like uncharacterized protein YtfP
MAGVIRPVPLGRTMPPEPCTATSALLFVYGTLMRDGARHAALAGQRFLGEARTEPCYALLDLGEHPGLVRREPGGRAVCGELYEVAGGLLAELDEIEGAPELFRLGPVAVAGRAGPVSAYFYQPAPGGLPTYGAERWDNRRSGPAP